MSKQVLHAINIKNVISYSVYGVLFGCLLAFVPVSSLVSLIILLVGLSMIFVNGYKVYIEFKDRSETTNQTLFDVLGVLLGFVLIVMKNRIVTIVVALYLMALPIIDIIKSKGDKNVVLDRLPKIVLGIILLFGGFVIVDLVFKIIGIILMVVSLGYFAYNYYLYKKSGVRIIK